MPLVIDDSVAQHVTVKSPPLPPPWPPSLIPLQRVRDGALVWFIAEYEGKEKIKVTNSGSGNFDEFKVCANARLSRARALPPASDPSPSHAISMLFVCD